jgi:hypothetical protein
LDFVYSPLAAGEIRVIELEPCADTSAPIFCRLRHVPLDDFPEYEAVSYTWGSEKPVCKIRVDEGGFWVAPNLEAALVQFGARAIRTLWIDAICINQNDWDKRSKQVQLMSRIYEQCKRLLVWLGSEKDGSDHALEFIDMFEQRIKAGDIVFNSWINEQMASKSYHKTLKSLAKFFSRPWFKRAWILQYILGGGNTTRFMCRTGSVSNGAIKPILLRSRAFVPEWGNNNLGLELLVEVKRGLNRLYKLVASRLDYEYASLTLKSSIGTQNLSSRKLARKRGWDLMFWLGLNRDSAATDLGDKFLLL